MSICLLIMSYFFFFQAEDGIRDLIVTGVQTCALPISSRRRHTRSDRDWSSDVRSEEHTSELQSRSDLVCRLLLEKKRKEKQGLFDLLFADRRLMRVKVSIFLHAAELEEIEDQVDADIKSEHAIGHA